jgi:translocation and assembly module TamB
MRWLARLGALAAVVAAAALLAAAWLLGTEAGLRWAIARAEAAAQGRLRVEGARGVLAGTVGVERLSYAAPGWQVEARGVALAADLLAALGGRLALDPLAAESVTVALRPGGEPSASPPSPPFGIALRNVAIDHLVVAREAARHDLRDVRFSHLSIDRAISAQGALRRPDERFPLQAEFSLEGSLDRLEVSAALRVADVPAKAKARLRPFGEQRIESLEALAGPVDLSRFDAALPETALSATLEAKGTRDGLAGTLLAANAAHGPLDAGRLPLARVETRFSTAGFHAATLERLLVVLSGGGTLEGKGRASREAPQAELQAELRAAGVDLRSLRSSLRSTRLDGPLQLRLSREAQRVSGRLSQDDVSVEAELERRGDVVEVRRLRAAASGGEVSGEGRLQLKDLAFEARLSAASLNPAAFGDYPEGSLNGSVQASGVGREVDATWSLRDSTLLGRRVESRGSAHFSPGRVSRAKAEASYGGARLGASGAFGGPRDELAWQLEAADLHEMDERLAGRLAASGTLSGSWSDPRAAGTARAQDLHLPGGLRASELGASFKGRLAGHELEVAASAPELELRARLRGAWDARQRSWAGEILSLSNRGDYPITMQAPAALRVSRERVELGRVQASIGEGRVLVRSARWQPGRLSSSGEFRGLPAQWLAALTRVAQRVRGDLLLDGEWSLEAEPKLEGTVELRRARGDLSVDDVALALGGASVRARFTAGQAAVTGALDSRYAKLSFEALVSPAPGAQGLGYGAHSPLVLNARADLAEFRTLAPALAPQVRLDGRLWAEVAATGTLGEPALAGKVSGESISVQIPEQGVYLRRGELRASLEGDAVRIVRFAIQGGSGRFTASGLVPLRRAGGDARLEWRARNLTVVDRPDMRMVTSGSGEARFDGKRLSLAGELELDRGELTFRDDRLPQLGEDVVIVGEAPVARGAQTRVPVALDLVVDLGERLEVRARGYDGRLAGRLQVVTNREGELRAYGELRAVKATFLAYGQRLEVDPGVLVFDGPVDNPSLQVTAWRRNQAVEAGVQITGTARAPRVQLVSQPPVPEGERLSWLVLGRGPSEATQADLGLLQAAAGALLAGGDSMPIDRRLARAVGLDEVSLRGTGEVQDRVVAFGKRLSDRVYVSYERGLGTVATNLVKLDYALSQRWSLRAETGSGTAGTPTSGWGLFYRFSWD